MNFSRFFYFSFLLLALLISSCNAGNKSESVSVVDSIGSIDDSNTPSTSVGDEPLVEIEFDAEDRISDGASGGWLTDVDMGRFFAEDTTFVAAYVYGHSASYRYASSREDSVTIEKDENSLGTFNIITHKPGDSILSIYDDRDMLVYRNIIRVRKAYNEIDIAQVLFDFDVYKGFKLLGNHRVTFTTTSPLTGILGGTDDVEVTPMSIVFEAATYVGLDEEKDMHEFLVDVVSANEGSQTKITRLKVSRTGEFLALYYRLTATDDPLLNLFFPLSLQHIYKDFI